MKYEISEMLAILKSDKKLPIYVPTCSVALKNHAAVASCASQLTVTISALRVCIVCFLHLLKVSEKGDNILEIREPFFE